MDPYPLVLLANEPAAYRSLLASELPLLRPNLRMLEIHPAELDTFLIRLRPAVVICSRTPEEIREPGITILTLGAGEVGAFMRSRERIVVNPRLSDILGALDCAVSTRSPGPSSLHQGA